MSVIDSTSSLHEERPGLNPRTALQQLRVAPIPRTTAMSLVRDNHYLHSYPGGSQLDFGVFTDSRLQGVATFGVGPANAHRLVHGAVRSDVLTLSRLWLVDELPPNSESRTIGVLVRYLRKHTDVKFLLSYADPSAGHVGTIYQAANWIYTGWSEAMPLYDLGDGVLRHSRSVSHAFGSHSKEHFANHGINIRSIPQSRKHRYLYLLDPTWRSRLRVNELPYPKKGGSDGNC